MLCQKEISTLEGLVVLPEAVSDTSDISAPLSAKQMCCRDSNRQPACIGEHVGVYGARQQVLHMRISAATTMPFVPEQHIPLILFLPRGPWDLSRRRTPQC